ncbi:hypothetical protein GCM10009680_43630 [Streptomyces yatensis]|uniref:Uncharacterized protein n=1 Tax=Streptomyces yatensis TaxID=155177 RepID=A0ABP4U510_9ACTN
MAGDRVGDPGERGLFPAVTAFSAHAVPSRCADCARALGAATTADSDIAAADKLVDCLSGLCPPTTPWYPPPAASRTSTTGSMPDPRPAEKRGSALPEAGPLSLLAR